MAIRIIGTSHISEQSLREVRQAIEEEKPDIVAIELDSRRLGSLMAKERPKPRLSDAFRVGLKGYLFALFGAWGEKKLGEVVGVKPGSEMKLAVTLSKKHDLKLALIDQDIEITLKRLSQEITWKEKWDFFVDLLKGVFGKKEEISFDLRQVPEGDIITSLINRVKDRYPSIYKVLILERNEVMIKNIKALSSQNPGRNILVIIGAGHQKEIAEAVNEGEVEISYHLPEGMQVHF